MLVFSLFLFIGEFAFLCLSFEYSNVREINNYNNHDQHNQENLFDSNNYDLNDIYQTTTEYVSETKPTTSTTTTQQPLNDQNHHASPHRHHNGVKGNKKFDDELIVNTQNGYVKGRALNLDSNFQETSKSKGRRKYRLNAWLGIPYAEKPIGDLRFRRPVPVKNWEDVLDATQLPNSCCQLPDTVIPDFWGVEMWNANTNVSEDCLYLNIWTPHPRPKNSAVMVCEKLSL